MTKYFVTLYSSTIKLIDVVKSCRKLETFLVLNMEKVVYMCIMKTKTTAKLVTE